MPAYVSVPRDLSKVKEKVLFNLTKRQLLCFGAAALIGVPSFFMFRKIGNISMATLCMMILMLPMFFLGMYEKNGQPLEVIAGLFIQAKIIRPKVRPYRTDNYYELLIRQEQLRKEVESIVEISQSSVRQKADPQSAHAGKSESCRKAKNPEADSGRKGK